MRLRVMWFSQELATLGFGCGFGSRDQGIARRVLDMESRGFLPGL